MTLFDDVGRLYVAEMLEPSWNRFGARPNVQKALTLFCRGYAYERAEVSPDYAPAAGQAIAEAGRNPDPVRVWKTFRRLVDGPVNPEVNPLWHRDRDCDCLLCVFRDGPGPRNIVSWARRAVAHDRVRDADAELRRVRGVGPKIASFFLRDVALRNGLAPGTDRWRLQPVDLWVSRLTGMLHPELDISDKRAVANSVVADSRTPELANAGLWYFGARIAPRRLDHTQALTRPAYAQALVQRHVERMDAAVAAWTTRKAI